MGLVEMEHKEKEYEMDVEMLVEGLGGMGVENRVQDLGDIMEGLSMGGETETKVEEEEEEEL